MSAPGGDAVTVNAGTVVRLAGPDVDAYALLAELGAGTVRRRPGRAPYASGGFVSVSRTDGMVAVALSDAPAGIDVERVRPLPDLDDLVRDHLGPTDAALVRGAADPLVAFYEVWTGLEALLKAEGTGIVAGLDPTPEVRARWRVTHLDAGPDHRAAVAAPVAGPAS